MARKKIDWEKLQNDINAGKFGSGAITTTRSAKSLRRDVDSGKIRSVTNNNNLAPIKHEDNTTYKNTGKKIGDYIKDSSMKNYDIFQKGNKFYYYDNKNKNYKEITNKTGYSVQKNGNAKDNKTIAPVSEHFNNKQQLETEDGKFEETKQVVKAREDKLGLADRLTVDLSGKNDEEKKQLENELVQQAKDNSRLTGAVKGLANSGYIKAGAFDDGYQFGDVTKTVGSTLLSGLNSIGRGTIRTVEGIGDAATYILAGAGDMVGLDGMADSMKEFAKKDLTNEITMPSSESVWGEGSVLGEKSDSIAESIGGFLPNVALGGVASTTKGATALSSGTMFTSSYGQGVSEAYASGATDEEAQKYGLINGVANTATEMMFGGLGKGTKALGFSHGVLDNVDDALAQKVTNAFSSQLAKNLTQYTIKATGEGIEEVAAGLLQGIGKKMTFESEKDLNEILNDEQLLDQFIGGAVASGIMQAPGLVKNTKQGRDLTTGFTNNEKKVFENVSNARFEQELQNNTDMSKTEKNILRTSIEKQTKSDIENGNLSIQEIQNALGSDDYQTYQQETQRKQDLEKQLKELQKKSSTDMSYSEYNENNQKMTDLQNQIDSINLDDLKSKVDTPIESRIGNNDYLLQRSYNNYKNNQAQKGIAFKHEVSDNTKISTLEKNVYDSASKVMNNTKESHNLADFVSKLSKDTGVQYEFTTSEDLKNRGYNIDNRVINGLNTDDGKILINVDSDSIINRVVGHETTHLFENTEDYKKFQNEVFEYAKTKGDFDKLKAELTEAYKNVKGANIDNELTSELVGQYIFSDTEFVQNLSKHRNIFQKIYDEIKHLYKMATAGSKEARQLEKVKRAFEKVYQNNTKASTEAEYHVSQNISDDIDKVLNGSFPNDTDVKLRDFTPKILVKNGIKDYPMLINQNHIKSTILTESEARQKGIFQKNANYHGIGKEKFIKAIDSMDNPLAVIKSKKDGNKNWVVITDIKDNNGDNIIVPIYLETKGNYNNIRIDTNKIKSLYGKQNLSKYVTDVYKQNSSNIVYFSKQKNGVATGSQSSNRNIRFSKNNVSQSNNNVKSNTSNKQYAPTSKNNTNYSLNNDNLMPLQKGEIQSQDVRLENRPIAPINKSLNNPDKNKTKNVKAQNNTKASKVNLSTKKVSETEFKKDIKANAKKMSNTINSIIDSNTMTVKSDLPDLNIRSWIETAIESDVVDNKILLDDINMLKATYEVKSNKKSLEKANNQINLKGYDQALQDFNSLLTNEKANISVENIVMGERLVQEAMKSNDYKTAQELIENIAILGTELGQKVQALSVIQRLTPEGQLRMLTKTIQRAKIKGDKAFGDVRISPEMAEKVLSTYNQDGTWNQDKLTEAVEEVKGEIAEQMKTTVGEKANAWRYLSMLGNPKTHIRNLVSNVAMKATRKYKNFIARSIEAGVRKIQNARGKETTVSSRTFTKPSEFIIKYSEDLTMSLRDVIQESNKYDEATELNRMKTIFDKGKVTKATEKILSRIKNDKVEFQNGFLEKVYRFNSDMLQKEDWWFSSSAFRDTLTEYLTANNIRTQEDLDSNPQIVERAKAVALEESQKATFQQYSWIASKINQMEHKNVATQLVVGGMIPFKKTPINIAKAGLSYSPIGLTKSLTYDLYQVKNGNMEASQAIDNMAQGVAGTSLMLLGYVLAKAGVLNGAGDDDKKGKYDNQLGTQSYSIRIGDSTYSLNWLSPVAMPLFVGVNFQNQLEEQEEWDMNVLTGALAQTLDPLTEMSVLQSLNQALSSYNSDEAIGGQIGQAGLSAFESYLTQFIPTASSYIAGTLDDKKRTTTPPADSKFKQGEAILNQIKYKIPGLRQTLPVSQDIWGNEVNQADSIFQRAFENFLLPASKKKDISDVVDDEIISLYNETGETGIIPSTPPKYLQYEDEKYNFSSKEYTEYRKTYGTTAKEGLRDLFNSQEYINASNDDKVKYIEDVYDYAREKSKVNYFKGQDVSYEASPSYEKTSDYIDSGGTLASYVTVHTTLQNIKSDKDDEGNSINGTASGKKAYYIMNSNLTESQKNWFLADMSDAQPTVEELSLLDDDQDVYNYYFGLNSENKEKFTNFAKAGISQSDYIKFKNTEFKSDKDSDGKTISGSKKSKIISFVNELPLSVAEKAIYIKSAYKTFDDYNNEIINYINSQDLSIDEKSSILEDLGFEIKGGRVYW